MLSITRTLLPKVLGLNAREVTARAGSVRLFSIISPDPGYNNLTMGPYPKTKEERILAAKKYNLIPEDYETYPEDEGFGDYPKLPTIGTANRDPYDDYDDPVDRRYYGEPFHLYYDLYQYERHDPMWREKLVRPLWATRLIFIATALFMPCYLWFFEYFEIEITQPRKQQRPMFIRASTMNARPRYAFPDSGEESSHGGHH